MIVTRLMGGLGNQMFQYAAGLALAKRHETPLLIDLSFLQTDAAGQYTQRRFELDVFKAPIEFASAEQLLHFGENQANSLIRKIKKFMGAPVPEIFREKNSRYDAELRFCSADTLLIGFWQSEKYFRHISPLIREAFTFRDEFVMEARSIEEGLSGATSVSVHVRRGDYVNNKAAGDFHGICSLDYYKIAMKLISEKFQNVHFYIFSDDLDWCRDHLGHKSNTTFVNLTNAASELYLMSRCSHHIIANSSFSWWGAWLNSSPGKFVIAPHTWFRDLSAFTEDIYCEDWIRIK